MRFTVYDLESTGLNSSLDVPVSFAWYTFDESLNKIEAGVMYFYHPYQDSSPGALEVHQLTRKFLETHKGNYTANVQKMYKVLQNSNVIGFNNNSFDNIMSMTFLAKEKYKLDFASSTDLMRLAQKVFGAPKKLKFMCDYFGIDEETIKTLTRIYFKDKAGVRAHDATYDVMATYLVYVAMLKKGMINNV